MSKTITSNLLLINDLQTQINALDSKVDNFTETEFDSQINAVKSSNIYDQYGKERFTGSKDWHFRFDFYSNINGINEDNLNEYSDIKPLFTDYIHAKNLRTNVTIDKDLLDEYIQHYESNIHYIIKVSTNILFNDKIENIKLQDRANYYSINYSYYINNKIIQSITTYNNSTHPKSFNFLKGWNRIDIFLLSDDLNKYHQLDTETKEYYTFKFYFNPLNSLTETSTTNTKDDGDTLNDLYYLYDRVEHFTAYFINSTELIPNNQLEVKDISIDSVYYLEHNNILSNTYKYSYHILEWNDNYSESKIISDYNTNITYTLDRIIIKNDSLSTLNNVWLEFNINNNNYSCNALQNIESQNEHIIYDLNFNIDADHKITHSLSNLDSLIYSDYSIFFYISMKEPSDKQTKALKISNNIHQNSLFITNKGSVGIGTNDTGNYSLYVNNISNDIKGIFCADDLTILSDIRYKTDIKPITDASSKLLLLNGVSYKKNDSYELGLLAQEVQSVLPELVNNNNDELGVKYLQIIPLLIEGFKELKNEINKIKKII
jgi:hypothetical protein